MAGRRIPYTAGALSVSIALGGTAGNGGNGGHGER